jgi:hypothetical protein
LKLILRLLRNYNKLASTDLFQACNVVELYKKSHSLGMGFVISGAG